MPSIGISEVEQLGRERRRPRLVDRGRPAGEDQRLRLALADLLHRSRRRQQLGEHPAFADPPGDQLRVLAPEVEDQHLLVAAFVSPGSDPPTETALSIPSRLVIRYATPADTAARPLEPMPTDCSFWSFLPSLISAGATITSARWKERMSS